LDYQKDAIESLARSAHAADIKYQVLQTAIKATALKQKQSALTDNFSRASTIVVRTVTVDEHEPQNRDTSFDSMASHKESAGSEKTTEVDSKPLIGELILCFNLVHNLLGYHIGVATNTAMYKSYLTLRRALESAHETELDSREGQYGDTAYAIAAEAAKNALLLQRRLRELARHGVDQGFLRVYIQGNDVSSNARFVVNPFLNADNILVRPSKERSNA
jgi:hypothetical protein